LSPSAAQELCI